MSSYSPTSQLLKWARVAVVLCGTGLALIATFATTSGCEKKQAVSKTAPAEDADMKKVIINVFGMT